MSEEKINQEVNEESIVEIDIYEKPVGGEEAERNGRNPSTGETLKIQVRMGRGPSTGEAMLTEARQGRNPATGATIKIKL